MPLLRVTALFDAQPRTVAGLLRHTAVAGAALRNRGLRVAGPERLLARGDEVTLQVRILPGVQRSLRMRVESITDGGLRAVAASRASLIHTLTGTAADTRLRTELCWRSDTLGRLVDVVVARRLAVRLLVAYHDEIRRRVAVLASRQVVVATALVRGGRVLVAQRTRPPELAGRWELPGGSVEPGESESEAVVRECREELDAAVRATGRLGTDLPIAAGVLRVHRAVLVDGAPEPRALEHAALRWVGAGELEDVDWVDADRAVVADLAELLAPRIR